ncbi:hypothetical protein CC86DRAFT_450352 [Ophiobolus disseminans]|uniref:Uncharacterized protein n=1 Tax=Ophiobolus disseminans TaxID=1469910 RepID=A0A6A6ZCQ3_9PLEO|nr:hypothetical protein CC86DRAFT_450352 [Ophiobolus disseminans]
MRTVSHMGLHTAVKMNQQASACSGFPTLTPLPTHTSPTVDSCYSYPVFSDHQDLSEYSLGMEAHDFPVAGRLTPQTPEPLIYHDPLSISDMSDQWMPSQPWSGESLEFVQSGFDSDITPMLPAELWAPPDHAHVAPITQLAWNHPSLSASPQELPQELVPHMGAVPSLSISECSVEEFNGAGAFHENWTNCLPITTQLGMTGMVTQAPFMHGLGSSSSAAPMWEDVFMQGPSPY